MVTRDPTKGIFSTDFIVSHEKSILQALIIALAGLWIYWPVLQGDWLWDDDWLITQNAVVHDPAGLWKIWFQPGSLIDYQPIKVSVVWLQWHLWGMDTLGYHLTNVLLHVLSALLVWRLLSKFRLRAAWLGGLLFAIHPVAVESVAWIAELKNTLSLPPFLLAMCFYIDYETRGSRRDYFLALGLFLAALLCKTTMVMFPVVILLHAWWKRGRLGWNDLKTSAPFFALSLVMGLITVWFLQHHAIGAEIISLGGFGSRVALAGVSIAFYFSQCFWPVDLLPLYPKWTIDPPSFPQFVPWPVLGGILYWFWTKRARWGRHALLGLGFFLINLAPFLGFTAGSYMSFTWVIDHVLYIPIMGLIGLAVAGLGQIDERLSIASRPYGRGALAVVMALLAFESHGYAGMFINQEVLWTYTLKRNPDAWLAHNNLGSTLLQKGRVSDAMEQFQQVLQIKPDDVAAHTNLGAALEQTGRPTEAMDQYKQALKINPNYAEAHYNLGLALRHAGRIPEAMEQYEQALRIKPDYAEAHNNLGYALLQVGKIPEALEQFEQALRIKPDYAEAHNNRAVALANLGRIPEAIEETEAALRFDPHNADARTNLLKLQQPQNAAPAKK